MEGLVGDPVESKHAIESATSKLKDFFESRHKFVYRIPITVEIRLLVGRDNFGARSFTVCSPKRTAIDRDEPLGHGQRGDRHLYSDLEEEQNGTEPLLVPVGDNRHPHEEETRDKVGRDIQWGCELPSVKLAVLGSSFAGNIMVVLIDFAQGGHDEQIDEGKAC